MTRIRAISYALPEREVSNAQLDRENPSWKLSDVAARTGVLSRRWAKADETAFDLSVRACSSLVDESRLDLTRIDAILYCTQMPDYPLPGNAHLLHRHLGLEDRVLAFDYSLACSGYVYGLAIADSLVRGGLASEVLLVTAETTSKLINRKDRSTATVFGDGAAVTHLSGDGDDGGLIVACDLRSHGGALERLYVPAGGARTPSSEETRRETPDRHGNVRSPEDMRMDGPAVWAFVSSVVPRHLRAFLAERSLTVDDIDLCVVHQASRMTFDSLAKALGIEPEKLYVNLEQVGNLGASSIPVALRAALDEEAVRKGDRVLLSGFGAGLSYGCVLVEF